MSRPHCPMVEPLESRTLLSATPVFNSTVKLDRLDVRIDLLEFKIDCLATNARLNADTHAMKKDGLSQIPAIGPLITQLHTDVSAMSTALKEDRLTEAANSLADQSVIKLDLRQILLDKGNSTALTADHAKLMTDRIQLQNDLIMGLDMRIATRTADSGTISTDCDAIVTAVMADKTASTKLLADATKFSDDKTARLGKLQNDLTKIETARTTLVTDLTAEQSM